MAVDKRELILKRLVEILTTVTGAVTVVRNRGWLSQDERPALYLMDGTERERLTGDRGRGSKVPTHGHERMTPQIMTMKPEMFIVLKSRKPQNDGIGEAVSAMRNDIIRAIAVDTTLQSLTGSNGAIAYIGLDTDLRSGSPAEGQMRLDWEFTYVLDPYEI